MCNESQDSQHWRNTWNRKVTLLFTLLFTPKTKNYTYENFLSEYKGEFQHYFLICLQRKIWCLFCILLFKNSINWTHPTLHHTKFSSTLQGPASVRQNSSPFSPKLKIQPIKQRNMFQRIFGNISIFSEIFQFRSTAGYHPIKEGLLCFKISNICV